MTDDWARPVVHWEIRAHEPERLRDFYRQLFNWTIGDGPIFDIAPGGPISTCMSPSGCGAIQRLPFGAASGIR
jgi:hypothetical protein